MTMRFLPVNQNALLVELDDLPQTLALLDALRRTPPPGIDELVPAARTILVRFRPARVCAGALAGAIARLDLTHGARPDAPLLRIPVRYDGEDLAEVAALLGISIDEVVRRHTGADYSVAFTGFAPGFAYLSGGHPSFDLPRRATPRTRVAAGAVGLAGRFSGIYPQASPGGWQLIGTTPLPMWDLSRNPPALLQPGARVRFVDIATLPADALQALRHIGTASPGEISARSDAAQPLDVDPATPALEIVTTGAQSLLQDLGRPGLAAQGVSASGALDRAACMAANRLVGNAPQEACIESVGGGLALRSRGDTVVAVCGADAPLRVTTADGTCWPASRCSALALCDGEVLSIGEPRAGARSYVALRGGVAAQPVLGSLATDTLARLGPPPLAAGDVLAVREPGLRTAVSLHEEPLADLPTTEAEVVLDVIPGPRTDWFTADALALLAGQRWRVTPHSNRVGLRLAGAQPLQRAIPGELPSEGTVRGALQVPPSGQPVLFLADHPLTGGYPVIAAVALHHLDRVGQVPVGASLRFRPIAGFAPITPCPTTRSNPSAQPAS